MSGASRNVFILVHGTWARNSDWTKPGSAFQTLLTNHASGCEISRISWRGRNREGDREQGVEQLKASIKEQFDLHPNAKHFVVAHSHGGNIAATAVADPEISRHLAGLVCFNTPFLVTVQRNLVSLAIALGFVAVFAVPLSLINQAAVEGMVTGNRGEWELSRQWIRLSWPLLAVAFPFQCSFSCHSRGVITRIDPELSEPPNIDCPVLCVRTAGDEAFAGLTVVEAVAELPNILLHPISCLAALIIIFALVMGGVITPMSFTQAQSGSALWLRGISSGLVSAVFYVNVLLICTVAFTAVAASALRSVALGLGSSPPPAPHGVGYTDDRVIGTDPRQN